MAATYNHLCVYPNDIQTWKARERAHPCCPLGKAFHKKPDNLGFISQWSDYLLPVSPAPPPRLRLQNPQAARRFCDRHENSTGAGENNLPYLFSFGFALAAQYLGGQKTAPGYRLNAGL